MIHIGCIRLTIVSFCIVLPLTAGPAALLAQPIPDGAAAAEPAASRYEIRLLEGTLRPDPGVPAATLDTLRRRVVAAQSKGIERVHVLVQLYDVPGRSERLEFARQGLDLGPFVPGSAWIAAVPAKQLSAIAGRPAVRWLTPWDAPRKLHPRVKAGNWAPWTRNPSLPGWVMVLLQLHHDVTLERGTEIAQVVGGVALPPIEGLHGMTVWLPEVNVARLAELEEVLWVQEGPPPLSPTNDGVRATMKVDPVTVAPYNLDGTGVRLFVFDGGTVRATHETFSPGSGSRVTAIDSAAPTNHATHVAGTAAGDGSGSASGRGRGVATDVSILSASSEQVGGMLFWDNAGDIEADYALARNSYNADLGTNSLGSNIAVNGYPCEREGDYGVSSSLLDGIVRGDNAAVGSAMIMTWSAGNERGGVRGRCGANYRTTGEPACAKNPIHIGALNSDGSSMTSFSSWGPCDDGRLKPIVSAPGCETGRVTGETTIYSSYNTHNSAYEHSCGTSMATPAVGGTVSLLIEDWRARGHGSANDRPLPALVKSLLIHSARDLGLDGPDFIHGYGGVDAKALIDTLRAGTGTLGTADPVNWGPGSLDQGEVQTFFVNVPAGTGELKASLAWDDAAAAAFAASAPVNDLTLELIAPGGAIYRPWVLSAASPHLPATTGVNSLDNQEQVLVNDPAAGTWTVRVTGTAVPQGPQTFGLVYSRRASTFDLATCTTTTFGFEAGNDGWTLTGTTARVATPAAGHGSFSLRLGGTNSTTDEATRDVVIPAGTPHAELSLFWYMTTQQEEGTSGFGWDSFQVEIRNTSGTVLAVVDYRNDGWLQSQWLQQANLDLTPWAGQTVRLALRAVNSETLPTTFWADDVSVVTCSEVAIPPPTNVLATASGGTVSITWTPAAGADGYNVERKVAGAGWVVAQTVMGAAQSSASDTPVSASGVVLYRVVARAGTSLSSPSNHDVAYVGTFTDDPVLATAPYTTVKAAHIIELRRAVNGLCEAIGLPQVYSGAALDEAALRGQLVDDAHFTTLMTNLNAARTNALAGLPPVSFRNPPAQGQLIRRTQIEDLRNGVK